MANKPLNKLMLHDTTKMLSQNPNTVKWTFSPIPLGSSVTVKGRAEPGDVAALTNVTGTLKSVQFNPQQGNTYTVTVSSTNYNGILPSMVTKN